jgi:two-component system, response regulator
VHFCVTDGRLVPVLLIDDDENDVVLFRRSLLATGAKVRLATLNSGQAAMDYLNGVNGYVDRTEHPLPHLIFLDAHLPGVSGSQVLQFIKSNIALAPIPVIVLTGAISPNETLALYRSGANAICLKPLTAGQLEAFTSLVCRFWIDTVVPPPTR